MRAGASHADAHPPIPVFVHTDEVRCFCLLMPWSSTSCSWPGRSAMSGCVTSNNEHWRCTPSRSPPRWRRIASRLAPRLVSRLFFSLGAFPTTQVSLVRVFLDLFLDGHVLLLDGDVLLSLLPFDCMFAHPCGLKAHGSALLASVCMSSHQSARASWLTWLVRLDPCQSSEPLAYMYLDSCARVSVLTTLILCYSACLG